AIDNGGTCSITSGSPVGAIAPGGSATLGYQCTYGAAPSPSSFTNTATATWDSTAASTPDGSATGSATGSFTTPTSTVNQTINVPASSAGTLGTATAVDTQPFPWVPFSYSRKFPPPSSGCLTVNNTATIVETAQTASASVKNCNTGALTMGFWQNKN